MRVREDKIRAALKRILPFKPTAAQKRVLAEIAGDLERPYPMHRLLEGDVGSGKTIVALEAATIVDRKRLPGGADGADGNSGGAAFSFRATNLRAGGLQRGIDRERPKKRGKRERDRSASAAARRNSWSARTR